MAQQVRDLEETARKYLLPSFATGRADEGASMVALDQREKQLENERQELEKTRSEISALREEIQKAKAKGRLTSAQRRALEKKIERHNQLIARFNKQVESYDTQIEDFNARVDRYNAFFQSSDAATFWQEVSKLYGELLVAVEKPENQQYGRFVGRLERLRKKASEVARDRQARSPHPLVLVDVQIGELRGTFIVDTGASNTTIPPWMVGALGLEDALGESQRVELIAGLSVEGPRVVVPEVSVHNKTVQDVDAVVLTESQPGIDGLLGQSFLENFVVIIDPKRDEPLELR